MTKVIGKEVCPHCGQTINRREIVLSRTMLKGFLHVVAFCQTNGIHEFDRSAIAPYLLNCGSESTVTRFGDWIYFSGGIVYKNGKGHWGINMERAKLFLQGKLEIPIRVAKKNRETAVEILETGSVFDVKGYKELFDEMGDFIVRYVT